MPPSYAEAIVCCLITEGVSTLPSSELVVPNGIYTLKGWTPFLCRSHSVLSDHRRGVHPSEQRARCVKRSLYTEGFGPPSYGPHSVLSGTEGVSTLPSFAARCAKRSLYTEGFGPPSYAPHSVLSGTEGGRPPFRALALVVPDGVYTLKGLDPLPMPHIVCLQSSKDPVQDERKLCHPDICSLS